MVDVISSSMVEISQVCPKVVPRRWTYPNREAE